MLITLNTNSKTFRLIFTTSLFLFSIVLFGSATYSWTGPSGTPPNNNVATPINVSGTSQVKSGALSINGLYNLGSTRFNGNVGIGGGHSSSWSLYARGNVSGVYATATNGQAIRGATTGGGYAGYFVGGGTNAGGVYAKNSNGYYAFLGYPGSSWGVYTNGRIYAKDGMYASAFYYNSDRNLKHNISTVKGLDIVNKLRGVSFAWNNDNVASVGLIAQEVEEVLPELVTTDSETGLKSVQYGNLVAPLIEAVKEQQRQIQELETRIELLESRF